MSKYYKTVVLSDIHLGSRWSHCKEALAFLNSIKCDKLILNGDIIDGWKLIISRKRWKPIFNQVIYRLLDMNTKENTHIVYVRGNHDDFLDNVLPFDYYNFEICKDHIHIGVDGNRYYVFHGDSFDNVTSKNRWISKIGDKLYSVLLQINRHYNDYRRRAGKSYYSISKYLKIKVKMFFSDKSNFDKNIVSLAKKHNCSGVICGHIHQSDKRMIGDVLYLNSGDWIESMTAIVETESGEWELLHL